MSQLADLSGNENHFHADAGYEPTYNTDNGFSSMTYDGAQALTWGGAITTSGDFTKVVVFKMGGTGTIRHLLSANDAEKNILYARDDEKIATVIGNTVSVVTAGDVVSGFNLVVSSFDASSGTVKQSLNGGATVTQTNAAALTDQDTIYLGARNATGSSGWEGEIAAVLVFENDLLDAAQSAVLSSVLAYVDAVFDLGIAS